jgi:ABC-type multidrug transport system ATPase subunit
LQEARRHSRNSIRKSYGNKTVLTAASIRAVEGEFRVLLGRNGSGKSTLLRIAAGYLPADSGTIEYGGRRFLAPRAHELAQLGLFLLPDRSLFSSSWSVASQLTMLQRQFAGRDPSEVAATLGIERCIHSKPQYLSGGELRRAELAAALVRRPRCLLADEPLRGLPPKEIEYLLEVFANLAVSGVAVVVTGHEVNALCDHAHRISWCTSGTTYDLGPPSLARQHDGFRREYLGEPQLPRN